MSKLNKIRVSAPLYCHVSNVVCKSDTNPAALCIPLCVFSNRGCQRSFAKRPCCWMMRLSMITSIKWILHPKQTCLAHQGALLDDATSHDNIYQMDTSSRADMPGSPQVLTIWCGRNKVGGVSCCPNILDFKRTPSLPTT